MQTRVANKNQVSLLGVSTRAHVLQRQCACGTHTVAGGECESCHKKEFSTNLQRAASSAEHVNEAPSIVHEVLRSPGQSLDADTRAFFEPRFGHDFSQIRVHTDSRAAESARSVNALAYTVGRDIAFGAGRYAPGESEGRRLLAHELTHTIQQSQSTLPGTLMTASLQVGRTGDAYEHEADRVTDELAEGATTNVHLRRSAPIIQRATPTGITLKEAKPFGHADLKTDELKNKFRTYVGSTTLMQVTPTGNYKDHCVKEFLTEVSNTCPARFQELRKGPFCTESKCLEFDRHGSSGDPESGKTVTDGPDTFIDRHRTSLNESLLEGTGKNECSVVCHQRYKFDRKDDLGSFYIIRNFKADHFTPAGAKAPLHITTGQVIKVPADLEAPTKDKFAKDVAPGLVKKGQLVSAPPVPKAAAPKKSDE
jgi:Domain of unknown function (DUF4157)